VVFTERFPTADGRATLVAANFTPGPEQPDADYPLVISTGRVLEHWHTGAMTRHANVLEALAPVPTVSIHPDDAQRLGVKHGETIRVESHHGAIEGVAELTRAVKPGHLFLPFAYWEAAANRLTGSALDPFGKIPGFKVTAVRAFAVPT
jgi:formate dehydrogenase major subunit